MTNISLLKENTQARDSSLSAEILMKGVFAYSPETVYSFRGNMQKPPQWFLL